MIALFNYLILLTVFLLFCILWWVLKIKKRQSPLTKWIALLFVIPLVWFNPFLQYYLFEDDDPDNLAKALQIAREKSIEGKDKKSVEEIFGSPSSINSWTNGILDRENPNKKYKEKWNYETWYYKSTPFYMLSREFEIHFENGKVTDYQETMVLD